MNLPQLPKQHKKQEADFGVFLRHWIEKNPQFETCAIETKHSRGKDRFNFNELKDEQVAFALKTESKDGVLVRVRGLQGEQDYIYLREEPSLVCVKFPKGFCMIDIKDWVKEKQVAKSLTYERGMELSTCPPMVGEQKTKPRFTNPEHTDDYVTSSPKDDPF